MPLCGYVELPEDDPAPLGDEIIGGALLLKCIGGDAYIGGEEDAHFIGNEYWMEEGEKIILEFVGNLSDLFVIAGDSKGGAIVWMKLSGPTG